LSLKVTLLGTGTSHGVPMIGCDCSVCRSTDPRDRRSRPSILLDLQPGGPVLPVSSMAAATRYVLVDTSSDLRAQALTYDVRRVDAILFTHSHADHIFGLDEVRRYNSLQKEAIPCYADAGTAADLRRTFAYIFDTTTVPGGGIPQIVLSVLLGGPFCVGGVEIVPIPVLHGRRQILGFRIGSFAYLTDCSTIPDASWPLLDGVRTLVLDALREKKHPTHFNVSDAIAAAARIGATRTYFTHISHDLSHAATCARLPPGVELAYDGLVLTIE
jgi:phosphoribosyl 1,2-cyclic phosphate phosphodiesterase